MFHASHRIFRLFFWATWLLFVLALALPAYVENSASVPGLWAAGQTIAAVPMAFGFGSPIALVLAFPWVLGNAIVLVLPWLTRRDASLAGDDSILGRLKRYLVPAILAICACVAWFSVFSLGNKARIGAYLWASSLTLASIALWLRPSSLVGLTHGSWATLIRVTLLGMLILAVLAVGFVIVINMFG